MGARSSAGESGRPRFDRAGPVPAWLVELICLGLALAALHPLLTPGYIAGHDTGAHLFRLSEVARALRDGVLYPRFVPDAYGGLGGPVLNFNPVAPYYLPALLVLGGSGPIAALKISAGFLMIAGGFAVRILARPHAGRIGAAIAGLAYVYLPYRIADLYVRMAYSELAAMVILPLAMAAARRAACRPAPRRIAVAGLALGALLAVHFPASVIGVPFVLFYALASVERGGHLRAASVFGAAFLLALMLAAFCWLPAFVEVKGTHYEDSTEGLDNYRHHFLGAGQLLSPRWGFGSSMPGAEDQMSFQLGLVHLLALVVLVGAAFRLPRVRLLAAFCGATVLGGSFMMLTVSKPIWDRVPILPNLQFPWRLLMLAGIATSLAAGVAAILPQALAAVRAGGGRAGAGPKPKRTRQRHSRPGIRPFARSDPFLFVPALLVALLVGACLPYLQARTDSAKDSQFEPEQIRRRYFGELKWQPLEVATLMYRPEGPRATLSSGGQARIVEDRTHRMAVEVDSVEAATLRLHLFNTPGWSARIGEEELVVRSEPGTAMVLVDVPAGGHRVELRFENTPLRRAAWFLSAAGLILFAAAAWGEPLRRRLRPDRMAGAAGAGGPAGGGARSPSKKRSRP